MQRKIYELNNILKSRCSNSFYLYFLGCSTMFPRIVKSKKKSGTYEYLVISESVHIKGKGSTTRNIAVDFHFKWIFSFWLFWSEFVESRMNTW